MSEKEQRLLREAFKREHPIDLIFTKLLARAGRGSGTHLEMYKYFELQKIRVALETIADKMTNNWRRT